MNIIFYITTIAFVSVCLFMILLVLVQKGRGGGLAAAFGGMGGGTAFGAKTGDVLTWTTAVVFGIFVVLAVVLNYVAEEVANPLPPQTGGAATIVPGAAAGAGALDSGPSAPVETPVIPATAPTTQAVTEIDSPTAALVPAPLVPAPTTIPATTQP